jgi:hypothetical protein
MKAFFPTYDWKAFKKPIEDGRFGSLGGRGCWPVGQLVQKTFDI